MKVLLAELAAGETEAAVAALSALGHAAVAVADAGWPHGPAVVAAPARARDAIERALALPAAHVIAVNAEPGEVADLLAAGTADVLLAPFDAGRLAERVAVVAAQAASGSARRRLETLVEAMPDLVAVVAPDGMIEAANGAHRTLLGHEPAGLVGRNCFDFVHSGDRAAAVEGLFSVNAGVADRNLVIKVCHADGRWVPFEFWASVIPGPGGKPVAFVLVARPAAGSPPGKRAEKASDVLRDLVFESTSSGIAAFDTAGRITLANRRLCEILGASREEVVGYHLAEVTAPGTVDVTVGAATEALAGNRVAGETVVETGNGRKRIIAYSVSPLVVDGAVAGGVTVLDDVTALRSQQEQLRESEDRYRSLVELSPSAVIVHQEGWVVYVNRAGIELFGAREAAEILGREFRSFIVRESPAQSGVEGIERADVVLRRADGGLCEVELVSGPTVYRGQPAVQAAARDVSDARQAERLARDAERLARDAERRYRALFDEAPAMYVVTRDARGVPEVADCNNLFLQTLGYNREEVLGRPISDFYTDASRAALESGGYRAALRGQFGSQERELVAKDGTVVPCLLQALPDIDADGRVVGTRAMFIDITEQKRAEEALAESEERFERVFQVNPVALSISTLAEGRFLAANDRMLEFLGYTREQVMNSTAVSLGLWANPADRAAVMSRIAAGEQVRDFESASRLASGEVRPALYSAAPITLQGEKCAISAFHDITDRKRAEEELAESEARFAQAFNMSPVALAIASVADGTIIDVNERFLDLYGVDREEAIGTTAATFGIWENDADRDEMLRVLAGGGAVRDRETRVETRNGPRLLLRSEALVFVHGFPSLVAGFVDITERKRAEEERFELERRMLETQKLESLGVMAGGIAHDFNNLLVTITGNTSLGLMATPPASPVRGYFEEIELAAQRAADLARQMLAYSGRGQVTIAAVDLNGLVDEMSHLLQVSLSRRVRLALELGRPLPLTNADATQVRQVIMNFVINASEAIGDSDGTITLRTGVVRLGKRALAGAAPGGDPGPGRYVYLEAEDTGCGMDEETRSRMFEPFFTTKFTGRGLGMAAVLGIVRGHGGGLTVDSKPGVGTRIRMLLPALAVAGAEASATDGPAARWRGEGTVVVVDDEPTVCAVTGRMLERLGFRAVTLGDGEAALAELEAAGGDAVMVLLDMTMPKMDGVEVYRAIRERGFAVPVVMMSGFSEGEAFARFEGDGPGGYLQKPFTFAELEEVARAAVQP